MARYKSARALVEAHLDLAEESLSKLAREYWRLGLNYEEALSIANLAIMTAADSFCRGGSRGDFRQYGFVAVRNALVSEGRRAVRRPTPEAIGTRDIEQSDGELPAALMLDLEEAMQLLSSNERVLVRLRFGLDGQPPLTIRELPQRVNRTAHEVRRDLSAALQCLRRQLA